MSRVRRKDTQPELVVRRLCRELGFVGYRLHRSDLPGRPDIAWIGRKSAIFVNGCFWHSHKCSKGFRSVESNKEYWNSKFQMNRKRDASAIKALRAMGWQVCLIWECELKNLLEVKKRIKRMLDNTISAE